MEWCTGLVMFWVLTVITFYFHFLINAMIKIDFKLIRILMKDMYFTGHRSDTVNSPIKAPPLIKAHPDYCKEPVFDHVSVKNGPIYIL